MGKQQQIVNLHVLKGLKVKLNDVVSLSKLEASSHALKPSSRWVSNTIFEGVSEKVYPRQDSSKLRQIKLKYALEEAKQDMKYLEEHLFDRKPLVRRGRSPCSKKSVKSKARKTGHKRVEQPQISETVLKFIENGYEDEWLDLPTKLEYGTLRWACSTNKQMGNGLPSYVQTRSS